MAKSADAFRTISEVSEWLDTPAHVLRFWESKFTQVKPVKRAGGRRYYRPSDMELLGGIKRLLHEDGMTIKGVQKLLREKGVAHVADLSQPLDDVTAAVRDAMDEKAIQARKQAQAAAQAATAEHPAVEEPPAPEAPAVVSHDAGTEASEEITTAPAPETTLQPAPPLVADEAADPAPATPRVTAPVSETMAATAYANSNTATPPSVLALALRRTAPLDTESQHQLRQLTGRLSSWLERQSA